MHTVTRGKRHNAGYTCEEKNHTKTCECVSERNIVTMDECFWINATQWCAWLQKQTKKGNKTQYMDTRKEILVPNDYLENALWLHGCDTWIKRHRGGTGEIPVPIAYLEDVFWLPAMMVSTNALGGWSGYRQGRSHWQKETNIRRIMNRVLYQACQLAAGCVTWFSCDFCQASIYWDYRINMTIRHGYLSSSPWWTEFRIKPVDWFKHLIHSS